MFAASSREGRDGGAPWFSFAKADRRVSCYYFYVWDEDFGPAFVKVCCYFPYPMKICLLTELPERSLQFSGRIGVWVGTVPTHDRFRGAFSKPVGDGGSPVGGAEAWRGSVRPVSAA
ncbi:MAG: hypothetical protein QG671_2529 [Actinomycetota bacterium]|nr:hypothetical protein [Actinomycetota bacterium]